MNKTSFKVQNLMFMKFIIKRDWWASTNKTPNRRRIPLSKFGKKNNIWLFKMKRKKAGKLVEKESKKSLVLRTRYRVARSKKIKRAEFGFTQFQNKSKSSNMKKGQILFKNALKYLDQNLEFHNISFDQIFPKQALKRTFFL